MAVRVAATLRLADLMAGGAVHVAELAERTGTNADALGRLLRHLACHGVFAELSPGRFTSNETADLLRADHPLRMRMWLDLDGFGGRMDLMFTELMHTVRTGKPAFEAVFGASLWDYLDANPAMAVSFDATLAGSSMAGSLRTAAVAGYDWSGVRHVVDVGGGNGALLAEVLRANVGIRATLVDLPDVVARGRQFLAEKRLEGRCEFAGQSFFDPLPAGGDVYLLSGVLNDWSDELATAILRRCAEAAGQTGRVVIVEHSIVGSDPGMVAEMDLRMLVLCGGRERSVESYGKLASAAALAAVDVRTTRSGHVVIDCQAT
jgi:hypothetical protein